MEHELDVLFREDRLLVLRIHGRRSAAEVENHGVASAARGAVHLLELSGERGYPRRVLEARAGGEGCFRHVERRAGVLGEKHDLAHGHGIRRKAPSDGAGKLRVAAVGRCFDIGVQDRHQVGAVELPGLLQRRDGVVVLHHPRRHEQAVVDLVALAAAGRVGKRVKRIEYGVDELALLRLHLRKRVGKRRRVSAAGELHRGVVRHAEDVLGILRVERNLVVDGNLLEDELLDACLGRIGA